MSIINYNGLSFQFDRTAQDVQQVKSLATIGYARMTAEEKALWSSDLPGAFNVSDMNRIMASSATLYQVATGSPGTAVQPVVGEWATLVQLSALWARISAIRGSNLARMRTTPEMPAAPLNDWRKLNAVEQILYDMNVMYDKVQASLPKLPEMYVGEGIGLI